MSQVTVTFSNGSESVYDVPPAFAGSISNMLDDYRRAFENSPIQTYRESPITMPLTKKGKKIKSAMAKEYGEKKGEQVFYASRNKGKIKGVDRKKS